MKKVDKCSDLYTSRGSVRHRLIPSLKRTKTAVDVFVPGDSCPPLHSSMETNRQNTAEIVK